MAGIPFKSGLVPVNYGKAADYSAAVNTYRVAAGYATAIFSGAPVAVSTNGYATIATSATHGQAVIGVCQGAFWIDPTTKKPVESRYLPAGTSSASGSYNGVNFGANAAPAIKVIDDLDQVYAIKCVSSIAIAKLNDNLGISPTAATGGNTVTGQSSVKASTAGDADSLLQCVGVFKADEFITATSAGGSGVNDWGAPNTVVLVKLRKN